MTVRRLTWSVLSVAILFSTKALADAVANEGAAPRPESVRDLRLTEPPREDSDERIAYQGGPVPEGYRLKSRARHGLLFPGVMMFGAWYGTSAVTAAKALYTDSNNLSSPLESTRACAKTDYLGFIPVAGALLWGIQADEKCHPRATPTFVPRTLLGLVDSGLQFTGVTLTLLSFIFPERYLVREVASGSAVTWRVLPGTPLTGSGLSLAGNF